MRSSIDRHKLLQNYSVLKLIWYINFAFNFTILMFIFLNLLNKFSLGICALQILKYLGNLETALTKVGISGIISKILCLEFPSLCLLSGSDTV